MSEPTGRAASPPVVATRDELRRALAAMRRAGRSIGFVPTMGALHSGHLSLVDACRRECAATVASIFVNPTQFGPGEDFERYPRPLEADLAQLAAHGVDLVFAPPTAELYPPGHAAFVDVGPVAEPLEGRHRPGHFRGVATVVLKLFNIVAPDRAYFGRKDYQQSLVICRLVRDFDLPIEIRVCPTIREPDGLALSSRNVYLSPAEREQALVLSRSLRLARDLYRDGQRDAPTILGEMQALLAAVPQVRPDYVALVDAETLADLARIDRPAVALIAARVGRTRLIDNMPLEGTDSPAGA
jgi:pantoate--beta-alanine ligase